MKGKIINLIIICAVIIITAIALFFKKDKPLKELPYLGHNTYDTIKDGDEIQVKENYHTIGNFNFINQEGKTITPKNFEDKIYVAQYFFTSCKSICPRTTNQMQRVYEKFKNENKVLFISHTCDPEFDSVNVLAEYANKKNVDPSKWFFVTGSKEELYNVASKYYYLTAEQGGPDDFNHSPDFILVDENKHIRGSYDGTDSVQVDMLIKDIKILLASSK